MQKIIVIVGPTAVGKSDFGLKLAQAFDGQIISGDSMQIYQEVAIGTAKPSKADQAQVKHYLVDEKSIFDSYSVKDFVAGANDAIKEITTNHHLPIVVGGTGFYINALINKMQLGEPGEYKDSVASEWEEFLAKWGPQKLWDELNQKDPVAAQKIAVQNSRRTLRALTVISRTGKLFSAQQQHIERRYNALIIGLNSDRQLVYNRINHRVDKMLAAGLLDEAKFVYDHRKQEKQAIQAIGYKELFPYFEGEQGLSDAVAKLKQASRKYAKRQLTYFKHQLPVEWFDPLNDPDYQEKIYKRVNEFLTE
ncbi:tRNA (adenosine(37)-N6)-dimethylallyltransferase MiaA [Lactobacillus sp. PV034]|uniref:tRNA (adenosine(37)-N6)-dimethylallyltransferase MiaA n=1 Tax=Lactobacillus sp. PV034 TaxID=2594495 RepID=UPI002240C53A|nr:tRNA (adenosine(37)-N6)-dimethylallyltransferase MiaA [Lactobacillus sp. PV034]QNQ80189.1 tRNA (adenosine(37)-N6)-dimethylallyltransferase MiaA [Lactobacillus sp. PV034]